MDTATTPYNSRLVDKHMFLMLPAHHLLSEAQYLLLFSSMLQQQSHFPSSYKVLKHKQFLLLIGAYHHLSPKEVCNLMPGLSFYSVNGIEIRQGLYKFTTKSISQVSNNLLAHPSVCTTMYEYNKSSMIRNFSLPHSCFPASFIIFPIDSLKHKIVQLSSYCRKTLH